jgi:signal transduction histidine kinase
MIPTIDGQAQPARFRTDLAPKYGSWIAVAIVYGLWAAVLLLFFRFSRSFERYADLVEALNGTWSHGAEGVALASELRIEVLSEATLLGAMVLIAVTLGGALFLHRSRYLERLLAQRAAEIEAVDRSRRLFFATASHEMRTPVTAIRSDAEIALWIMNMICVRCRTLSGTSSPTPSSSAIASRR